GDRLRDHAEAVLRSHSGEPGRRRSMYRETSAGFRALAQERRRILLGRATHFQWPCTPLEARDHSRRINAFANRWRSSIVVSETLSTSAISGTVNPAKKRSSTTSATRG